MIRKKRERWSPEKKEAWITSSAVTLPFLLFLVFLFFMASLVLSSENLRLENAIERAFNTVIVAMRQGASGTNPLVDDSNITGFGYYTYTGSPIYRWGDSYAILPFTAFTEESSISDTLISMDNTTGRIECMRYAETISLDFNDFFHRSGSLLEMPDILYLSYDASWHFENVIVLRAVFVILLIAVCLIYAILMKILYDNRKIRELMRKQENLVRLGEAARTLTHEIKNPLSSITLQTAILKREANPDQLEGIELIEHEASRLRALSNRVSEFIRNPLGQPEEVDLAAELEHLAGLFNGQIRVVKVPNKPAIVLFDRAKLRSVLENLMNNAIEACDGMDVDAEAELTDDGEGYYHIFIRDRGCGVSPENRKRIFDPFFTTKVNGSGIGLSISSQFLKAAGGSLRIYPRQGGGTIAEAKLPRYGV